MNSALTFAVSQRSTSGTVKKDVGSHKNTDFELALESSQSEDVASLISIERPSKILIGQKSAIEEGVDDTKTPKLSQDQKNEPIEYVESNNSLLWHAKAIEITLKKLENGESLQDNGMQNASSTRVSSDEYNIFSVIKEKIFYHGNMGKEYEENSHSSIDENFSSAKVITNEKKLPKLDYRGDNKAKFEDLAPYISNNFSTVDMIFDSGISLNVSNLTNGIVDFVIKDINGEHPVPNKSGSHTYHDFQPKIGAKFFRLNLEPQDLGPLTLCLRNDAEGLSVVVQTLATDVHQKLIEDKESMMRELNERGVSISEMHIQLHSGKDAQTTADVNDMSQRGAFDNKSPERGSSKNNNHLPSSNSDEQIKHAIDEKALGTYI